MNDEAQRPQGVSFNERETHLRSILATVPDAMVVIDETGRILSFSAAAEKMFGYAENEVIGENVAMLMPSPDRERHDGYLSHYRDTGERKIIGIGRVTTARHRDGYTFPIELSIGEAWLDETRIFTGFVHDITQRQKAELRLQDLQSELAHVGRVSEMGSLASSLAHELNQPLTAIANYCEAARDLLPAGSNDESLALVREALDEAAKETLRAGQIVQRLREFVRPGEAERRVESLARLVTEANALALRRNSGARDRSPGPARPRGRRRVRRQGPDSASPDQPRSQRDRRDVGQANTIADHPVRKVSSRSGDV